MPHFETFKKSSIPLSREPHLTIQKRGTITINTAAHAALGEPETVELLYDRDEKVLALRAVGSEAEHAAFVRPSARNRRGPWVISAMAFIHFYGIDTSVARRWTARLDGDMLCIDLEQPGTDVSKQAVRDTDQQDAEPRRPRPRPRRRKEPPTA